MGFSVGGAKDANTFRDNIQNGFLPLASSVTYEGVFYDYFFDTGASAESQPCRELFCPAYSLAATPDPISTTPELFLAVGLTSGLEAGAFARAPLNLVIVLDISGSMGSGFDQYHYGRNPSRPQNKRGGGPLEAKRQELESASKMTVANHAIVDLLAHLGPEDRLGVVLFDDQSYKAKSLRLVRTTNMDAIRKHVLELSPQGGTNMEAGFQAGLELFEESGVDTHDTTRENRIIFLTDAQPNTGATSEAMLLGLAERAANKQRIYTSFVGIGVDFNTNLIEYISKVRGCNYHAVHSNEEFRSRMDEQFEFMVSPLVFDLRLAVQSREYRIAGVFGSPDADRSSGRIMEVNTLFPSKTEDGETRGGVVLLQLEPVHGDRLVGGEVVLGASYVDREGREHRSERTVKIEAPGDGATAVFANSGVRKAVLLTRYVSLLQHWIEAQAAPAGPDAVLGGPRRLLPGPEVRPNAPGWERTSTPLFGNSAAVRAFVPLLEQFRAHFVSEAEALGDPELGKEAAILARLAQRG
eukprot:TRINITY_DN271_c0_g1_i4.p1 TRINITY_DN271_c0_g1~~TRINITY_DN271_c0_g1_i4.p1  ORF type:complete len:602 (+),score=150.32 TRINITY_DN271_c0_g1_i4:233-1807(+)